MKSLRLKSIPPRPGKVVACAAAVLLCYTLCGFFIVPLIARVVAVKQLSKQLDRPVTIQKIRLNPYTFSATIQGLLIKDQDGAPLVAWDEAYVNFQFVSLFSHAWIFKEVSLAQPFLRVQVNKDYRLNFSDLVDKFSQAAASQPGATGKPRPWRINRLRLTGGKVSFTDLTPRMPFQRTVGPLELTVTNFQTDSGHNNAFALSGLADGGEHLSWKGRFGLAPLRSEGEFSLDAFALTTYAPLYQDLFRFEIKDGVVSLHAAYRYESSAARKLLAVTNTTFALQALKLVEKDTGQTVAAISSLLVSGVSVDAMARQAEAETLTVTDGRFLLRRNRDTSVNAIELSKPATAAPNTPGGIVLLLRAMTNVIAMLLNSTHLSNGGIRELKLVNCALHLEDLVNSQPVRLDLEGIAVQAKNISNRAGTNMTAEISLCWDTNGTVRAGITAALSPPSAEVKLAFDDLSLLPLAPYLEPHLEVLVLGGKLGLAGTVHLRGAKDELPEIGFQGDAWLGGFSLAGSIAAEGLLEWNSLRLSGIEANLNPPVVSVTEARLEDAFARLIIETNRTINLMTALRQGGAGAAPASASTNLAVAGPARVSLASLVISNANVHFIDRSLRPHVNILLEHLQGTLSGLSSDEPQRADFHLRGTVDKSARAEIAGKINPWDLRQPIELKLSLQSMDLLPEDPYAGKYLGYRLKKGRLGAQLTYQIVKRKLKSENHITLDQLILGEKVAGPEATRLPVRLAIAILKDRDGRIALDLPVTGSLDDPQFSLGKVAYHALETVLTRIVTAPFSALGALFGGKGEELSFQEFQPGSANLLPAAIAKLDLLANGLFERPELQLELEGSADSLTDLEALRRAELNRQLLEQKLNAPLFQAGTNTAVTATPPTRSSRKTFAFDKGAFALRSVLTCPSVRATSSTPTDNHSVPSSLGAFADDRGATALMLILAPAGAVTDSVRERELFDAIEIASDALPTLAGERARNVRAYLLQTGKVEPQRIAESAGGASSKGRRVYVRLK
jgi:uncharacterized protein involved in outer membrane biogenesis